MTKPNGKLPLENVPSERAILGALVSFQDMFWDVKERVRPEVFTLPLHQTIVRILHELADKNRAFSIAAVVTRMPPAEGEFDPDGYLATLCDEADGNNLHDNIEDLEEMAARRQMMALGQELMRTSRDDNGKSAQDRLNDAVAAVMTIGDQSNIGAPKHIHDVAMRVLARVQDAQEADATVGLEVGLASLQGLIGALMPGRQYLFAGPPGSGKSALAQQIATYVAFREPVLFCSLEMPDEEVAQRDLAWRAGIAADRIERATVNAEELGRLYDSAHDLRSTFLHVDSSTGVTVPQIRAKAMRMKRRGGLSLIVIDHSLYLKAMDAKKGEFQSIRDNLQATKQLAKDLAVPLIMLAQLKAEFSQGPWSLRKPTIGDLYGGAALEQEADVILFVHRLEYSLEKKEPDKGAKDHADWLAAYEASKGMAELILAKRRGGRATGRKMVWFDAPNTRFLDNAPRAPETDLDRAGRFL